MRIYKRFYFLFFGDDTNLLGGPLALVLGVGDLGGLPLAVHVIIPVLGLGGLGIGNAGGFVVPVGGLDVSRVVDLGAVVPISGLGLIGILDLLRGKEVPLHRKSDENASRKGPKEEGKKRVPVVLELARLDLLLVDEDGVGVVGVDDQGVDVGVNIGLGVDGLLDKLVLALVVEDDVGLLGAANVGAKHDVVGGLAVEVVQVSRSGDELNVATAAVKVLKHRGGRAKKGVRITSSGKKKTKSAKKKERHNTCSFLTENWRTRSSPSFEKGLSNLVEIE